MASEPSSDLWRRIERAGTAIDPGLSDRDVERLVASARRLVRRRAAARRVFVGAALVLLAGTTGAGLWWNARRTTGEPTGDVMVSHTAGHPPGEAAPAGAASPEAASGTGARAGRAAARAVRLQDGSVAIPMDDGTELTLRESSEHRVAIDLERGRGRFEVTPRSGRTFSVRAGEVSVTVLGTIFTVERVADRVGVDVERGRVLVDWGTGTTRLGAGERGWFPPVLVGARSARPPAAVASVTRSVVAAPAPASAPVDSTPRAAAMEPSPAAFGSIAPPAAARVTGASQALAEARAIASPPPLPVVAAAESTKASESGLSSAEPMEALLAAADAARLQGHATDATAFLRRAVTLHPTDGRAPLAAFTLGRMLLVKLGQPREAAAAFAQARGLAPDGPLAEDALAREVEAWAGASERARAHDRAAEYLRRYPGGRRGRTVRAFGGLE